MDVSSADVSGGAAAVASSVLLRSVGALSVAVQRANYHLLAAASSGSCDDSGLLGRPLGEEVEFWRAVPGAAVLWASSEL